MYLIFNLPCVEHSFKFHAYLITSMWTIKRLHMQDCTFSVKSLCHPVCCEWDSSKSYRSNIVKALTDASLPHYGCFAHTLQLVVHDGVLSQRAVINILSPCRKIGHFRQLCLAHSRLRVIQENLGLPQHYLIQDEPTRWNSSLYMLQWILEQKMALAAYATEHVIIQLTSYQLE